MEKRDDRRFQIAEDQKDDNWNIVELESHRELRHKTNEIIQLCHSNIVTTSELRQRLHEYAELFGSRFALHLARTLQQHDNQADRQAIVWLLTLLNDKATIPLLQNIANQQRLSRAIRLSASLALAGMGATRDTTEIERQVRAYILKHSG
jgi:hypothetical protein